MNTNTTVILISGPPGSGKTTLAGRISENIKEICVHIEGDMLYNMVKKGWIHPCDDYDKFFLNILADNIVSLVKNFTEKNINVVIDYVFSKEQMFFIVDRIKDLVINIKVVVIKSRIDTLINRDMQRNGVAFVGEERIRRIVEDLFLDVFPESLMLENNGDHLDDLVKIVLNESRFTVQ